jgi:hypothetical protein
LGKELKGLAQKDYYEMDKENSISKVVDCVYM